MTETKQWFTVVRHGPFPGIVPLCDAVVAVNLTTLEDARGAMRDDYANVEGGADDSWREEHAQGDERDFDSWLADWEYRRIRYHVHAHAEELDSGQQRDLRRACAWVEAGEALEVWAVQHTPTGEEEGLQLVWVPRAGFPDQLAPDAPDQAPLFEG